MVRYLYKNTIIHGSDNRHERAAFWLILLALFVLTAWLDPV